MKKILTFWLVILVNSCGNQKINVSGNTNDKVIALTLESYKTNKNYTITVSTDTSGRDFTINAHMKCCGSPVDFKLSQDSKNLYIHVNEFWSAGIYHFEILEDDKIISTFEVKAE